MIVSIQDTTVIYWEHIEWRDHIEITKDQYELICKWSAMIEWDKFVMIKGRPTKNDTESEMQEKEVKHNLITSQYTISDQLNTIRRVLQTLSKDEELHKMWEFIESILKEKE